MTPLEILENGRQFVRANLRQLCRDLKDLDDLGTLPPDSCFQKAAEIFRGLDSLHHYTLAQREVERQAVEYVLNH